MNQQKVLLPEDIAKHIWEQINRNPNKVVYTLTLEDIVDVLAEKMADDGIPVDVFNVREIEFLLKDVSKNITLPWQEIIGLSLSRIWPELCRFDRFDPDGRGENIFYTTTLFWECECKQNNIHPRSQTSCPVCGHFADESPDADVAEVFAHAKELPEDLTTYLRDQWEAFAAQEEPNV